MSLLTKSDNIILKLILFSHEDQPGVWGVARKVFEKII